MKRLAVVAGGLLAVVMVAAGIGFAMMVSRSGPSQSGPGGLPRGSMGFDAWREGKVVATAKFDPGIAPFDITVRQVPVPATGSDHFIVELKRGQYVVSSFRYFWNGYTPQRVKIDWPCVEHFTVTFDEAWVATCDWTWGQSATWAMKGPDDAKQEAGLSAYYFTPRNPVPTGCKSPPAP